MEKSQHDDIEYRSYSAEMVSDDNSRTVTGYAALFNNETELWPGFREKIAPGAFRNAISVSDVKLLQNHDPNLLLGRSKSGTLKVREDQRGLYFEGVLPETSSNLIELMKRGDIDECSFAFTIQKELWEELPNGDTLRTIVEAKKLYDVSIVTYPQYTGTHVGISQASKRSLDLFKESKKAATTPDPEPPKSDKPYQKIVDLLILNQKKY